MTQMTVMVRRISRKHDDVVVDRQEVLDRMGRERAVRILRDMVRTRLLDDKIDALLAQVQAGAQSRINTGRAGDFCKSGMFILGMSCLQGTRSQNNRFYTGAVKQVAI